MNIIKKTFLKLLGADFNTPKFRKRVRGGQYDLFEVTNNWGITWESVYYADMWALQRAPEWHPYFGNHSSRFNTYQDVINFRIAQEKRFNGLMKEHKDYLKRIAPDKYYN